MWHLDVERSDSLPGRRGATGMPPGPGGTPEGAAPGYGPPPGAGVGGVGGTGVPEGEPGGRRYTGNRYGREYNEKDLARIRQTLELGRRSAAVIRIEPDSGRFTWMDEGGGVVTWKIGGGSVTDPVVGGGAIKTRVRWKGDAVVLERKIEGGGKVVDSFGLGLDGTRLLDYVEVYIGPEPTTFTRQYVREVATPAP